MHSENFGSLDKLTWHAINTYGLIEEPNKIEKLLPVFKKELVNKLIIAVCTDSTRLWLYPLVGTWPAMRKEGEAL